MKLVKQYYNFFNGGQGGWTLWLEVQGARKKLASGKRLERAIKVTDEWRAHLDLAETDIITIYP